MENEKVYEIFLSCERKNKPLCLKLSKKLKEKLGLKICMTAENSKTIDKPFYLIKKAISLSKIFICGMTKKYTETKECIDEIILANENGIDGMIILLEPTVPHNFEGLSFTNNWPKVKMFENSNDIDKWMDQNYDLLVKKIMELLNRPLSTNKCCIIV